MTGELERIPTDGFIGVCLRTPDYSNRTQGVVVPLARWSAVDGGRQSLDSAFDWSALGPSRRVFWPLIPPNLSVSLDGRIVEFSIEPHPSHHGTRDPGRDWYQVARTGDEGRWLLEPSVSAFFVVSEETAHWGSLPRAISGFAQGSRVFVHRRCSDSLLGPWTVRNDQLEPRVADYVLEYPCRLISKHPVIQHGDSASRRWWPEGLEFILLQEPSDEDGQPVDIATPAKKASWLRHRLESRSVAVVAALDRDWPGWKKDLAAEIEAQEDPRLRQVYEGRVRDLGALLESLADQDVRAALEGTPQFQAVARRVSEEHVAREADKIRQQAIAATDEVRAQEAEKRRCIEAETRSRSRELEDQVAEQEKKLTAIREEAARERDGLTSDETRLREAAERYHAERSRLVDEFVAFEALLSRRDISPRPGEPIGDAPAEAPSSPTPEPPKDLCGPSIEEGPSFIGDRLWPILARWAPGSSLGLSRLLHLAVLGCRWTLVPSAGWAKAYVEALGGTAVLGLFPVGPTWLRFEDAWDDGGVGAFWRRALADPERLYILFFQDVNRSLPQCWARPWLDLVAGWRDDLPGTDGRVAWPENLRVLCSRATDEAVLELPTEVLEHWGAVHANGTEGEARTDRDPAPGHVRLETWRRWAGDVPESGALRAEAAGLGPLAQAASRDLRRLAQAYRVLHPGVDEEDCVRWAVRARIEHPRKYLDGAADDDR